MKSKLLIVAMAAAIVSLAGCARSQSADTRTAMQKNYNSEADCRKEFAQPGDCVRYTTSTGGYGYHSPFFYPWGGIYHSNGVMSYNERVPTSGYTAAPAAYQSRVSSATNFSRVPASYSSRAYSSSSYGSSTRGGFGATGRSSGGSFGG